MSKTFILILLAIQTLTCQNQSDPNPSDCSFLYFLEPSDQVLCGTLEVPENHNQAGNKKIDISYVVLKATNGDSDYPLIYLSGGPGGSTLSEGRINFWMQNPIRNERDIILLDQRGIGHSSALPNIHEELYSIFAKDAEIEKEQKLMNELISNYKRKCKAEDIELEHYNSFQNAHDIGLLMEELNYDKYNLYGTSYGTRLARIVQEFYPQKLNAVVLNSPNPLVGDFLVDR